MAKVIFFNIPAHGHINPILSVVGEMVKRGEQVINVNLEAMRGLLAVTGADFRAYPETDEMRYMMGEAGAAAQDNIPRNAVALHHMAEAMMPFCLDLLRTEKPDYVIFDSLASWGKYAAELLNIPAAASVSTFVFSPDQAGGGLPFSVMLKTAWQMLLQMPNFYGVQRRMMKNYAVKITSPLQAVMNRSDSCNVVYTARAFQPNSQAFQSGFHFVGPTISKRSGADFPFEQLTRRPLLYISLGTINNHNLDFYRQCFAAFADFDGQVVLSVGKATQISDLGMIPSNFIVKNFVPQLEILERADLFVTHGGMNSVSEGLWYGVPMVIVPQQIEQTIVAQQTAAIGAGVPILAKPVTAEMLRKAADTVMAKREMFQQAAKQMGDALRASGGAVKAAETFMAFGRLH